MNTYIVLPTVTFRCPSLEENGPINCGEIPHPEKTCVKYSRLKHSNTVTRYEWSIARSYSFSAKCWLSIANVLVFLDMHFLSTCTLDQHPGHNLFIIAPTTCIQLHFPTSLQPTVISLSFLWTFHLNHSWPLRSQYRSWFSHLFYNFVKGTLDLK